MEREELLRLIDRAADEQWTELDLAGMDLTELPPEIEKLTNLTNLDLSFNQITEIPVAIDQLTSLTNLALSFKQITEIPVG